MPNDDALLHRQVLSSGIDATPYDPAKAHDYYMRTRQLKGRQATAAKPAIGKTKVSSIAKVGLKSKTVVKNNASVRPAMTVEQVKARVTALQTRLTALRKVLAELVKQAKARSGIVSKPTLADRQAKAKLTTADKTAAAKSSKAYYDKNKAAIAAKAKTSPSQELADLEAKIADVKDKIAQMRAEFAAAMKK